MFSWVIHVQSTGSPFSDGRTFFTQRSQSTDSVRRLAGVHEHQHHPDSGSTVTLTPIFSRSLHRRHLGQYLFGVDGAFDVTGSFVGDRDNEDDAFADYFGLSPEFQSFVEFTPKIHSYLVEGDAFINLNRWRRGLYVEITVPVGSTRWNPGLHEEISYESLNNPFPAGYQSIGNLPLSVPYTSFTQAIQGHRSFGAIKDGLLFNTIDGESHTKTGCADLRIILGWDFCLKQAGHAGFTFLVVAPTGSRPNGEFLFEPVLGNGKHWELGVGFTGHLIIWDELNGQELGIYTDIMLSHLFNARQRRTFDIKPNGFGSRYILAKQFDNTGNFTGTVIPVANISTLDCHVKNLLQLDASVMFGYTYNTFIFDIGYNGWVRSKDIINITGCFPSYQYGLKGTQNVYNTTTDTLVNATESTATFTEYALDKNDPIATAAIQAAHADPQVVLLTAQNIDTASAASPLAVTHKLFFYIGYSDLQKTLCKRVIPFFGFCAELEFEGMNRHATVYHDPSTMAQFTFWLRGGIEF